MFFDSMSAFLEMGGHGFYVWLSFGLTLMLIIGNVLYARISRRNFFRQHTQRQVRRARKGSQLAHDARESRQDKAVKQ